jgi:small subunit ribosomal protein S2
MDKTPDAIFIVDCKDSKTAIYEARSKNIPLVAICDTNVDVRKIDYPIPANDDAIKSLNLILSIVEKAILRGQGKTQEKREDSAEIAPTADDKENVPTIAQEDKAIEAKEIEI